MLPAEPTETSPLGGVYRAVPLYRRDKTAPLRLCVVVQDNAEAVGGPFVLLRDLADASVYLGCIIDAGLTVREWIEIWVQNLENFSTSFPAYRQNATNAARFQPPTHPTAKCKLSKYELASPARARLSPLRRGGRTQMISCSPQAHPNLARSFREAPSI